MLSSKTNGGSSINQPKIKCEFFSTIYLFRMIVMHGSTNKHPLNLSFFLECVVMNTPAMTDKIDDEEANQIEVKVQGKDADSKKTFKISKVHDCLSRHFQATVCTKMF